MHIQPTSALIAIDIDAGGRTAARTSKTTAQRHANRAIIPELTRQIRLRNLSGAILVDFAGMYVFCLLILMANLQRMGRWGVGIRAFGYYALAVGAMTAVSAIALRSGVPAQGFVAVLIGLIVWTELAQPAPTRRYFWLGLAAMMVASALSALDLARVICVAPNHWFQGHGAWHVMTALAIYLVFVHLRQTWRN